MRSLLVHQRLDKALGEALSSKKIRKEPDKNLPDILDRAYSAIILSLRDGVLSEVIGEKTTVWL